MSARRRQRSVLAALTDHQWTRDISGAPTAAVLVEYVPLWDTLQEVTLDPFTPDRFIWKWSACGTYTASSAYRAFFIGMSQLPGAKFIWRAAATPPPPCQVLLLAIESIHGKLWTAERRKRHGRQQDVACALYHQEDETVDHLLVACVFTREIWASLLSRVGLQQLTPGHDATIVDWWLATRTRVPEDQRRPFDSLVLVVSRIVWKERNARTFDRQHRTTAQVISAIREEVHEYVAAGFRGLAAVAEAIR